MIRRQLDIISVAPWWEWKRRVKKTGLNSTLKKGKIMASGPIVLGMHAQSLQWCPNLCNPMDYSPPASSVHGISQARILEWVAMPSSRGSSWPKDWTSVSSVACTAGRFFIAKTLGKPFGPIISWQTEREKVEAGTRMGSQRVGHDFEIEQLRHHVAQQGWKRKTQQWGGFGQGNDPVFEPWWIGCVWCQGGGRWVWME